MKNMVTNTINTMSGDNKNEKKRSAKSFFIINFCRYLFAHTSGNISLLFNRLFAHIAGFPLKKLFNKQLAFLPFHRNFYILLIANSKDHWVQSIIFIPLIN